MIMPKNKLRLTNWLLPGVFAPLSCVAATTLNNVVTGPIQFVVKSHFFVSIRSFKHARRFLLKPEVSRQRRQTLYT